MAVTVNIYYYGAPGQALAFAKEMISSGTVGAVRSQPGNLRYDYFVPLGSDDTVLLIDSWEDQHAIDVHHASDRMKKIAALREKYDLHMRVERYVSDSGDIPPADLEFIRK